MAPRQVAASVEAVLCTDLDLKRSAGDPRILLERLVVELSERRGVRKASEGLTYVRRADV